MSRDPSPASNHRSERATPAPDEMPLPDVSSALPTPFVLARVAGYLRPHAWLLALAAVIMIASMLLALSVPRLVSHIVDTATGAAASTSLARVSIALLAVFVTRAALEFAGSYLFGFVGEKIVLAVRHDTFAHLLSLSLAFFERRRVGELTSRVASDASVIQAVGTTIVVNALEQSIALIGSVVLVATINSELTLVLLAFLPGVALITVVIGRVIRRNSTAVQDKVAAATTVVEETLAGIETVKSFARESHELSRYHERLREVFRIAMKSTLAYASLSSSVQLVFFGGLAAVLWYAARLISSGALTSGQLVAFMMYTMLVGTSFAGLTSLWSRWQQLLGAGRRVFQIFLEQPTVVERANALPFTGSHQQIGFDHVGFRYPMQPEREVLHDVTFTAHRGDVIALVGESGAGKSTLAALLLRLYDVTAGAITIDGRDLRDLALADLRHAIAMVPQDIVVFGRTLRENIAYGKIDASDAEIVAAARAAHALEFIDKTPHGLATLAGERGVILSGGERQRIAIARAILKDPAILVLDEATSSLDSHSEALIKDALETLMAGRTTFVIAHRLSTIERAHRVVVLHAGHLVEIGTHGELLEHGGHYARLHRAAAIAGGA